MVRISCDAPASTVTWSPTARPAVPLTLTFVAPAAAGANNVVLAAARPKAVTARDSWAAPAPMLIVSPTATLATDPTRTFVSPAAAAATSVVLNAALCRSCHWYASPHVLPIGCAWNRNVIPVVALVSRKFVVAVMSVHWWSCGWRPPTHCAAAQLVALFRGTA